MVVVPVSHLTRLPPRLKYAYEDDGGVVLLKVCLCILDSQSPFHELEEPLLQQPRHLLVYECLRPRNGRDGRCFRFLTWIEVFFGDGSLAEVDLDLVLGWKARPCQPVHLQLALCVVVVVLTLMH